MWSELRNRRFRGLKFVHQFPVGLYFADFACRAEKIIIEVDGGTHSTSNEQESDRCRERVLAELGYRVFRVDNQEVYENIDGVMDSLLAFIEGPGDGICPSC